MSDDGRMFAFGAVALVALTGALRRQGSRARRPYDRIGAYESVIVSMDSYFKGNIPERSPWRDEDEAIDDATNYYDALLDDLAEFYRVDRQQLSNDMPDLDVYLDEIREKFRPKRISFRDPKGRGSRALWDVLVASDGFSGDAVFRVNAPDERAARIQAERYALDESELDEWEIYRGEDWTVAESGPPVRVSRRSFRE